MLIGSECRTGNGMGTAQPSPGKRQKRPMPKRGAAAQRAQRSAVVEQFAPASVAGVVQESSALKGKLIYFVPSYSRARHSKAELEAIVARLGGKVRIQKGSGNGSEGVFHHCMYCTLVPKAAVRTLGHSHHDLASADCSVPHSCMPPVLVIQNYIPRVELIIAQRADEETFRTRRPSERHDQRGLAA